jgi:PTS system nitrogen regulatory IIA component
MRLFDVIKPECIAVNAAASSKEEALNLVASTAKKNDALQGVDQKEIVKGLREREELGSTGFGRGIAIPHCRLDGVEEFVVGMVSFPDGVDFDAADEKPVRLIVFIVGPKEPAQDHIRLLSSVSQTLSIPGIVEELVHASSSEAARESLVRHLFEDTSTKDHASKNLFYLIVQDEDLFQSLLQLFSGMESTTEVVVDARESSEFLMKIPLFAGLLGDSQMGFCRIIVAVVEQKMTNEVIRRIENITGNLDNCSEAMLVVQETFYAAGALRT